MKNWLTLLSLIGIGAAGVITLVLILVFNVQIWVAIPVTFVTVAGLLWLGTRETPAPPLVMKESVWHEADNEQKEDN